MQIDDERGKIAPDLAADIIAVPEDPLADVDVLKRVNFVMKNARVVRHDP